MSILEENLEEVKIHLTKGLQEPIGPGVNELLRYMRVSDLIFDED